MINRSLPALFVLASLLLAPAWAQPPGNGSAAKGANMPLKEIQQAPAPRPAPSPSPPPAAAKKPKPATPKAGEVLLNFQAADVQAVVKAMSRMTGRNFLLDPRVKGQITIISSKPVSTASAYQIFLSALKAQGFTTVEGIGHTRIVPTTEAKAGADVYDEPRGGERIMTQVVIVQHSSATQIIPLLRPLMSPTSQLSAHEPGNALIITDYADNIRRLLRIIEKIDQPVSTDVTIIPLKHASALDLSDLVTRLSLPGAGVPGQPAAPVAGGALGTPGDRFTIVPDLRTNSLLVRADNPGRVHQIRSLIEKLDVPATRGGQTRVVYLRNADAVKLADVLRGLLAGETRAQQTTVATAVPTGAARAPAAAKRAEASLIQADEATNALIISAPDAVYNNLRAVIEKLDVRRTQVYIEALLVEMSTDAARELGVQWAGGVPAGEGAVAAIQNFPGARPGLISTAADPTGLISTAGLLLGYVGERVTLPDGTVIRSLGALARALESKSLANILSTPNLMTLDNAEAKIVVGQNVPFITGSFAQAVGSTPGTAVNPFQTIERKDVGLTLKIKPQVSEGGLIKLDIFSEQSSIAPTSASGASDLVTNKRSLETKVVVDDGHTIVLGGLIEDIRNSTESRVPVLGDLPLIGSLFRYREVTKKRTNLMVFLRPVIIYGPNDAYATTSDRYHYLRGYVRDKSRDDLLNRFTPSLPGEKPVKDRDPRRNDDAPVGSAPSAKAEAATPPTTPSKTEPDASTDAATSAE